MRIQFSEGYSNFALEISRYEDFPATSKIIFALKYCLKCDLLRPFQQVAAKTRRMATYDRRTANTAAATFARLVYL